jgi:hypothetical protein
MSPVWLSRRLVLVASSQSENRNSRVLKKNFCLRRWFSYAFTVAHRYSSCALIIAMSSSLTFLGPVSVL